MDDERTGLNDQESYISNDKGRVNGHNRSGSEVSLQEDHLSRECHRINRGDSEIGGGTTGLALFSLGATIIDQDL
jgi:hypothetical protein